MFLILFHISVADPYDFMVTVCAMISQNLDFLIKLPL